MRKIRFILMVAAIVFSFSSMAQLTYGPKLGLNLANVSGDDVENNSMLIGFNVGGVCNYGINDMISVQGELLFDVKGAKYEGEDENGDKKDYPLKLSYINIPILAQAQFGDEIKFYGELGPTIGLLMGASWDGESEYKVATGFDITTGQITYETKKVKESYKGTDIGLAIGAGAKIPMSSFGLVVGARYNMGLGSIAEDVADEKVDMKNGVISINIAVMFGGN
ncbi:MAG TPA: porin family protein [Bacteroidales bacterium]|nr:PorT family protein [Bacteroidales bacterium]HPE57354.1 porin family protein [Bacteroidales bacterium]HRX97351.1 porin family protein [Bacteroidales bacterium]